MTANDQLFMRMKTYDSLLCCGLDPDLNKIPPEIGRKNISDEEKVLEFLRGVVDVTEKHVCAYKAQKAFFDVLAGGHEVLRKLISYIHTSYHGIPIFVDCKIGDTDNTMAAYTHNMFDLLEADGVVVNPYMGDDAVLPLAEYKDKSIIVLVKTSNPSGGIIQDVVLQNGLPLWRHTLDLVLNRWNYNGNMIPVLSSTVSLNVVEIRQLIPENTPILFAGIGAQGGSCTALKGLLNSEGIGVFANSSRGILYPQGGQDWRNAVEIAAVELKKNLNAQRGTRHE